MFGLILKVGGIVMLLSAIPTTWIVREALKNEGPHRPVFWVGFVMAAGSYLLLAVALVMNSANWFGLAAGISLASYLAGITLQRIGRRRI